MVESAAQLLRTRGASATSFTEVLADSGAARGAIYHHFPGGKAELTREAVAWTGRSVQQQLASLQGKDGLSLVKAFLVAVRPVVADSAAGAGCAVAAATVECVPDDDELLAASRAAFSSWVSELERLLRAAGAKPAAAAALATLLIAFLEGSHLLCRAAGNLGPFDKGAVAVVVAAKSLLA